MGKKKSKKKRNRNRKTETREEKLVRMAKSRGGRGSVRHKDKTKYDRKKSKKKTSEYISEVFLYKALT